jgi:hypothetical protein
MLTRTAWYQIGSTDPISSKSQPWNLALTRGDGAPQLCARGDLNRAQPTLAVPCLASLSVK